MQKLSKINKNKKKKKYTFVKDIKSWIISLFTENKIKTIFANIIFFIIILCIIIITLNNIKKDLLLFERFEIVDSLEKKG